ncbi:MAG: MerR family DNA-binding transcriptional regulator [Congregibacter sp.]
MSSISPTFSISELASEFGISTRTVRFYEEKGFISPRRDGQRRIYSATDRARVRLILRGKRIGLSLAESIEIIEMYNAGDNDAAQMESLLLRISERRAALLQQRKDLEATLAALDEVESLCRSARRETQGKAQAKTQRRTRPTPQAREQLL